MCPVTIYSLTNTSTHKSAFPSPHRASPCTPCTPKRPSSPAVVELLEFHRGFLPPVPFGCGARVGGAWVLQMVCGFSVLVADTGMQCRLVGEPLVMMRVVRWKI